MNKLKELALAAIPGPWRWYGYKGNHHLMIMGHNTNVVIDFVRWGMGSAICRFNIKGLMHKLCDRAEFDHNRQLVKTNCPDADYIAAADPTTILKMITKLESIQEIINQETVDISAIKEILRG